MPRHGRDLGLGGRLLALDLVAHGGDGAWVGADEDDAGLRQRHGKCLALGQEAVAGVHGLGAGLAAGVDDLVDDEVGLGGRRGTDGDSLVRHLHMQAVPIGFGIDRNGLDAELPRALDDAAGDLAAVGDQDLLEHAPHTRSDGGRTPRLDLNETGSDPSPRPERAFATLSRGV